MRLKRKEIINKILLCNEFKKNYNKFLRVSPHRGSKGCKFFFHLYLKYDSFIGLKIKIKLTKLFVPKCDCNFMDTHMIQ